MCFCEKSVSPSPGRYNLPQMPHLETTNRSSAYMEVLDLSLIHI